MPTPRFALPYIVQGRAQKEVTHNDALVRLDAFIDLYVLDRDLATSPGSPVDGDTYLVAGSPTGAWAGQAGKLAYFIDGGWRFYAPAKGTFAYVVDEQTIIIFTQAGWADLVSVLAFQNLAKLGILTAADTTNRLAVKSDAVLLSHDDVTPGTGDMRVTLNKNAAGKDAGLVFQDSFSTRALLGLLGDDSLSVKVSPDGSSFITALVIDKASGLMTHIDGVVPRTLYAAAGGGTNSSSSGSGAYQGHSLGFSLPANFLKAGRTLRITSAWSYTTGATSAGLRIKLTIGGVDAMEQSPGTPNPNLSKRQFTFIHHVQGTVAPTVAASVEVGGYSNANVLTTPGTGATPQPISLDTNSWLLIEMKSQWDAAGSGNNSVTLRQLMIEALN